MNQALIVFAKPPTPGQVKTRLTSLLTDDEAAALYRAFLLDALDQYAALDKAVRLYWTHAGESDVEPPRAVTQHEQVGDTLGERMQHAFDDTLAAGYERAVIIGTDHPTLPSAFIQHAFGALEVPSSIVVGPSTDGGYYLLGMNAFYPRLFADMTYSHADVFAQTLDRAAQTEAHLTVLPMWYDIDEPSDLQRLANDLSDCPKRAVRTRRQLRTLGYAFDQIGATEASGRGDG